MSASLLGYPQVVLAVWCPLAVLGLWRLSSAVPRLGARERFAVGVVAAVTPLLAVLVPYLPDSPLRDFAPWRVPLAWGISNYVEAVGTPPWVNAVMQPMPLLLLLSLAVSFGIGLVEVIRTSRRVNALAPRRRGETWVVDSDRAPSGFSACTVGLLRPRIIIGSDIASSPNAPAVIEHEKSHARARHPLWIFLATCALRAWWWIPGRRNLLRELRVTAELWADQDTRDKLGAPAVARALSAHLPGSSFPAGAGAGFGDDRAELVRRALALAAPPRAVSGRLRWLVHTAAALAALTVVVLL